MRKALASTLLVIIAMSAVVAAPKTVPSPFKTTEPKEHVQKITQPKAHYVIPMGGTVDMDNTLTRDYSYILPAFQPNIALEIENTGDTPVVNPRIVTNGKRRWWSLEEMAREAVTGATNDQERVMMIWDFVRKNRFHYYHAFLVDIKEHRDPISHLNIYGYALCGHNGEITASLLKMAGINKARYGKGPRLRGMNGHVMVEAYLNDDYQFLDTDVDAFYLGRENDRVLSGDAIARDHDLGRRVHSYGPNFRHWLQGHYASALMGADDFFVDRSRSGYRMDMTLRPGEKIVYRWDNVGKLPHGHKMVAKFSKGRGPKYWANSQIVYTPRLNGDLLERGATSIQHVAPVVADGKPGLAGMTKDAHVVYEMRTSYTMSGGRIQASFLGARDGDRFTAAVSLDGKKWTEAARVEGGKGSIKCDVPLDKHLQVDRSPAKKRFFVRIGLASSTPGSARMTDIRITADVVAAPMSLPRLSLGDNQVEYFDESTGARAVTVRHRWRESSNIKPPPPPAAATFPSPNAVVRKTTFKFAWPKVSGADRYRLQVSKYPDFRICYMPTFDLNVKTNTFGSPYTGLFSPDVDYYWRVRSRRKGVWGAWSPTWHFQWDGPRVPVELATVRRGRKITLTWKPNPRGPRPVAYEVYGSDERGFSVSKIRYLVIRKAGRGIRRPTKPNTPPNFLALTAETSMTVVDSASAKTTLNRPFYRVVAVDKHGTKSGPSDYAELPHPFVYSEPVTTATARKPYRYQMQTLRSIGDLQARTRFQPSYSFYEAEGYEWTLAQGPEWLKCDKATGVLSGVPGMRDVGKADVIVSVKRTYPHEIPQNKKKASIKKKYWDTKKQATDRHVFQIEVRKED
jgi:Transglutaminase-like superfamily